MKKQPFDKKNQQGMALLAALLVIIIFTLIGMTIANKGKENQRITGAEVRQSVIFEATEQSLRDAITFIKAIKGVPMAAADGSKGRARAKDFKVSQATAVFAENPGSAIVWQPGALERTVCTGKCPSGVDFVASMDYYNKGETDEKNIWKDYAILSTPGAGNSKLKDQLDGKNYVANARTYTFIQLLRDVDGGETPGGESGDFKGSVGGGKYYLITVKGSGFPPGTEDFENPENARENVLLQAVYAHLY